MPLEGQNIDVHRRAQVPDTRGNLYEIDVYYEFELAGVKHRVAMDCKDTRRKVERNDVMAFHAKVQHMPSTVGVFISRSGFQASAARYLDDHGVMRLDAESMPTFGVAIAAMIKSAALPTAASIGQPSWGLAEAEDGEATARGSKCRSAAGSVAVV